MDQFTFLQLRDLALKYFPQAQGVKDYVKAGKISSSQYYNWVSHYCWITHLDPCSSAIEYSAALLLSALISLHQRTKEDLSETEFDNMEQYEEYLISNIIYAANEFSKLTGEALPPQLKNEEQHKEEVDPAGACESSKATTIKSTLNSERTQDIRKLMECLSSIAKAKEIPFDPMDLPFTKGQVLELLKEHFPKNFTRKNGIKLQAFEKGAWKAATSADICANNKATLENGKNFLRLIF